MKMRMRAVNAQNISVLVTAGNALWYFQGRKDDEMQRICRSRRRFVEARPWLHLSMRSQSEIKSVRNVKEAYQAQGAPSR